MDMSVFSQDFCLQFLNMSVSHLQYTCTHTQVTHIHLHVHGGDDSLSLCQMSCPHLCFPCHLLQLCFMSCLHRETCAHYRNRVMIMYGIEADCDDRLNHRYAWHVIASYPGSLKAGAERRAWYTLSAHAICIKLCT